MLTSDNILLFKSDMNYILDILYAMAAANKKEENHILVLCSNLEQAKKYNDEFLSMIRRLKTSMFIGRPAVDHSIWGFSIALNSGTGTTLYFSSVDNHGFFKNNDYNSLVLCNVENPYDAGYKITKKSSMDRLCNKSRLSDVSKD